MSEYLAPLAIIGVLIFLNGVFVAAEFAIIAVPRTRIAQLADEGSPTARHILEVLTDSRLQNRYIATSQVGITLVSLGLGMYGEHTVAAWLLAPLEGLLQFSEPVAHSAAAILAIGALTYLHVVLGEMIPKTLALQSAEPTVIGLHQMMVVLEKVFLPFVVTLNFLGSHVVRLLGIPPAGEDARLFTPAELEFIVEESSVGGLLEPSEQLFIENILDLQERTVEHVMTPRPRVVGVEASLPEHEFLRLIRETRKSRYPIYDKTFDQITGILHIKDLARHKVHHPGEPVDTRALARPTLFVPTSLTLDKLLSQMRHEHVQMAIVIDEYGGTSGIATMEDLIEEVVGEIQDEFDQEIQLIEELSPTQLRVRGDLILDELQQLYNLNLKHPEAYTIGGLIMTLLGRMPRPKDTLDLNGVTLEVESVERLAVQSVLIHLPPAAPHSSPISEAS